ncbi:MAG: hypothetical protein SH847_14115 [Roseiflexaceae bacterium]|nr:hypothetical protein [Roseiflexaceae bacterium]
MSTPHAAIEDHHEPGRYEIRIKGHLDTRWADQFADMSCTHASDGTTIIAGPVVDQAALHGLLRKVRDLGLPLVSVMQIDPTTTNGPDGNMDTDHQGSTQETNS